MAHLDFKRRTFVGVLTALVSLQQLGLEAFLHWRKLQSNGEFILSKYISTIRDRFCLKLDFQSYLKALQVDFLKKNQEGPR